jgi:Nucleotide modification associated domain 2
MPKLFSYCIPYDEGAAPNPYWGICTLVICKPVIRRTAHVGDWIVGTGAVNSPIGNASGCVVYAMQVTGIMTMEEYDAYTKAKLPQKIPDWNHPKKPRRLGDSLYDFSVSPSRQRRGVHDLGNVHRDLGGLNALLSKHFFYFGDQPVPLPLDLKAIVREGQGHRSDSNAPYFDLFVKWIHSMKQKPNVLVGKPQLDLFEDDQVVRTCAKQQALNDEEDEKLGTSVC